MTKKQKNQQENKAEEIDELRELKKDTSNAMALDAFRDSEGGKLLVGGLVEDILGAVETLATNNAKMTLQEFVAIACRIKERLDIVRALNGAKSTRAILQDELKKALEKIDSPTD